MTTSAHPRTPGTQAEDRVALRLHLADPNELGAVDGSWWPQSRDLAIEIADLVDHFPKQLGEVHRVVFSRPDWDTAPPRRVRVARSLVKVGSYPRDDSHEVWLSMSTGQPIRLSVQDPVRGSEYAPWTDAVHEPDREARLDAELDAGEELWTDEGGAWWAPHQVPPSHRT